MAASSKPTLVHFSLVFFVMTTLILSLVCYLNHQELKTKIAEATRAGDDATAAKNSLNTALNEIGSLKRALGLDFATIGSEGAAADGTVHGELHKLLVENGREQVMPNPQNPTVAATVRSLRDALNSASRQSLERQASLLQVQQELEQERTAHTARANELQTSQQSSEEQLQKRVADQNELLTAKDREINDFRSLYRREQLEKAEIRDEFTQYQTAKEEDVRKLENIIDLQRQQLNDLESLSFDRPDGEIVRVDNTTGTVWINLGSLDNLREQTSFSVYTKNHRGVGRGKQDIKAKIEVTKIRDTNLAEARIISGTEDIQRPIQAGDPIYSPAWSRGAKQYFSFVGITDFTGNGRSDRELLHSILDNANAGIEVEITDEGDRLPADGRLSEKTKFLVTGELEDPADFPGADVEKQEQIQKVLSEHKALVAEAQRKGIRIIRFSDFLNYIGYEQQQRLHIPGHTPSSVLKSGSRKASIDDLPGRSRMTKDDINLLRSRMKSNQNQP